MNAVSWEGGGCVGGFSPLRSGFCEGSLCEHEHGPGSNLVSHTRPFLYCERHWLVSCCSSKYSTQRRVCDVTSPLISQKHVRCRVTMSLTINVSGHSLVVIALNGRFFIEDSDLVGTIDDPASTFTLQQYSSLPRLFIGQGRLLGLLDDL